MRDARAWLNAIGIFAATTFVIAYFDVSPLWYSAALLAWIVRRQRVYHAREPAAANAPDEATPRSHSADQTAENL